jgi:hypothetical protein
MSALILAALLASGTVRYAMAERVYLDAGAHQGLTPGSVVHLRRDGREVGTCRIETVAETRATCIGAGAVGDTFALAPAPAKPQPPSRHPPVPRGEEMRREAALASAAFEKVEFHAAERFPRRALGAEVRLVHSAWSATEAGSWHQERLDVLVPGAPVWGGFSLFADLSARRWSRRADTARFRPADQNQLYVWEAALAHRPQPGDYALAFGRLRPRFVPGATSMDGAQAGWRTRGGIEAGLFGGAVPEPDTLAPSLRRGTLGTYWIVERAQGTALLRHEARVAFSSSPEFGQRVEGELLGQLWLARVVDFSADVRLGFGDSHSPGALDALRLDGMARPFERVSVAGGFRYDRLAMPWGGTGRRADLSATWDPVDWMAISALFGAYTDIGTSLARRFIGPELGFPRLFGGEGGVSLGFLAEDGWTSGRSTWGQISLRAPRWLRLLARLTWFQNGGLGPYTEDELSAYVSAGIELSPLVALRIAALGRAGGTPGTRPFGRTSAQGGSLDAQLAGRF